MTPIDKLWARLRSLEKGSFPNHPVIDKLLDLPFAEAMLQRTRQSTELVGAWGSNSILRDVNAFCLFIGHSRSGHSLIGSLLDAHPNMIVAHELDALRSVEEGTSKEQLFYALMARSRWFESRGAEWTGYNYSVPTQHKGEFTSLQVIGDKRAGATTTHLRKNPDLLKRLHRIVNLPIHVIHVKRHPLDNISTQARRWGMDLDAAIDWYFRECETVTRIQEYVRDENWVSWLDLVQEEFIHNTESSLRRICAFLGVDVTKDYLNDCAEIVFDSPSRSRTKVTYSEEQLDRIRRKMSLYPSLQGYSLNHTKTSG